jgi:amino acid transporter
MFGAQLLMALAQLHDPNFVIQNWYTALLSILLGTMVTAINVWGAKKLAMVETVFVTLHVAAFFIVLITVAVTSPKADAKTVFLSFTDNGGNYPLSMSSLERSAETYAVNFVSPLVCLFIALYANLSFKWVSLS